MRNLISKIVMATKFPFGDEFSPYREIEIPDGADEIRLALERGYDGVEIVFGWYANGERITEDDIADAYASRNRAYGHEGDPNEAEEDRLMKEAVLYTLLNGGTIREAKEKLERSRP